MSKTIEEIKAEVSTDDNFHNWESLFESCAMYDYGRLENAIDEVAQRYAQSQTQELQEQNAELIKMLEYIFYKTNFQNHFPTTSINVKNLLTKHNHLNQM